jgi:hypothetical protein
MLGDSGDLAVFLWWQRVMPIGYHERRLEFEEGGIGEKIHESMRNGGVRV